MLTARALPGRGEWLVLCTEDGQHGLAGQRTSQCLLDRRDGVGAAGDVSQPVVQCPRFARSA